MTDGASRPDTWSSEGEHRLASFTSEELVAVGADSPLQGLVLSERLAAMGPIPLAAALSAALRGLVARGFVHPEGATPGGPGSRADRQLDRLLDALGDGSPDDGDGIGVDGIGGGGSGEVTVPLSGDLAAVVAIRRAPALVCLVSEPTRRDLVRRGPLAHRRTDAILHGVAGGGGLAGILEERRTALGIHGFVLRGVAEETQALCASLAERAVTPDPDLPTGRSETAIEVAPVGAPPRPSVRLLVAYEPDAALPGRISWAGGPGTPATEQLGAVDLPVRLAEVLASAVGDPGDAARASAS